MTFMNCFALDLRTIYKITATLKKTTSVILISHFHLPLWLYLIMFLKTFKVKWYWSSWKSPGYWNVQIPTRTVKPVFSTSIAAPTNPAENAVNPERKAIALFPDSIPNGMRMKDLNSRVKGGKIHLKSFLGGKTSQLNNYIIETLEEYKYDCTINSCRSQ